MSRRRRLAGDVTAETWTLAFVTAGTGASIEDRVHDLVASARADGLQVLGVRIAVTAAPEATPRPLACGVRRLLKAALRRCGLRCVQMTRRTPPPVLQ